MQAAITLPTSISPRRPLASIAVLAAHALLLWLLLQLDPLQATLRQVATEVTPLMVSLVSAAAPEAPAPALPAPAAAAVPRPVLRAMDVPAIELQQRPAPPADVTLAGRAAPAEAPAAAVASPPPAAAAPAVAPPPAPAPTAPVPQQRVTGALRYLVEPAVVVPRLSRRAGEQGTVLLHVVVDVQGLPRAVTVRRSSGHARLDEQALAAMRTARFVPCTEQGRPVECEADAPIVYELQP